MAAKRRRQTAKGIDLNSPEFRIAIAKMALRGIKHERRCAAQHAAHPEWHWLAPHEPPPEHPPHIQRLIDLEVLKRLNHRDDVGVAQFWQAYLEGEETVLAELGIAMSAPQSTLNQRDTEALDA
jgi:hypothetical protein